MKKIIVLLGCFVLLTNLCFAQKEKDSVSAPIDLKKLSDGYFSRHDYDGFYAYLKGLPKADAEVYYYLALTRLKNIAHWQETKNWEGVYDKTSLFKKEIAQDLDRAEKSAKDNQGLILNIKYLRWQNVKDDDPDRAVGLFNDLVNTAKDNASSAEYLEKVKAIADELKGLEDKNLSRRLYEVYVSRIASSDLSQEQLKEKGEEFLKEGNAYLAKTIFEAYLNKFDKDKETDALAKEMVALAGKFAHSGREEGLDPVYAETMYKKAFDLAGIAAFDEDSQYLRAFNLERMKEFESGMSQYKGELANYPDDARKPEVYFRLGVLAAYAGKSIVLGEEYFTKIKDEFPEDPIVLSALYQLGLLSQWKKDFDKAKEFYNALIESAKAKGADYENAEIVLMARERLKEIEENKDIKYPLRLFLDETLTAGEEKVHLGLQVDLTGRPAKADPAKSVKFVVTTSNPQTGCMMPQYSYEWSGESGNLANIPNSPELITEYNSSGVKVIHVVVVGPNGPEGAAFEIVQITR